MKKRTVILSLTLAFAMIFCSFQAVFAAGAPTDATRKAIADAGVQCVQKINNEVDAEKIAINFAGEVAEGGYALVDTATLKAWIDNKEDIVVVDAMPESWWTQRHIPTAICSVVGAMNSPKFEILPEEETALLNAVKAAVGTKKVTKYYNKKTKKWQTKKIKGAKTKKVEVVNKDKAIVVYCGFTGCARSHQGAMFLVKQGFKNVYRYPGGISAWVDANYDIEGTDVDPAPAA